MLNLFMGIVAFLVCLVIVPAFVLATGFAAVIPLLGVGLVGQLLANGRDESGEATREGQLESLDDWRKRQSSTDEEVWRHTG